MRTPVLKMISTSWNGLPLLESKLWNCVFYFFLGQRLFAASGQKKKKMKMSNRSYLSLLFSFNPLKPCFATNRNRPHFRYVQNKLERGKGEFKMFTENVF